MAGIPGKCEAMGMKSVDFGISCNLSVRLNTMQTENFQVYREQKECQRSCELSRTLEFRTQREGLNSWMLRVRAQHKFYEGIE